MRKSYGLTFISDEDLYEHVKNTVLKYRFVINLSTFNENLVDPIKLTFDSKVYSKKIEDIIEEEVSRQIDKSNTNHIGYFHQNIFNYIGQGRIVPTAGYDIVNEEKMIYVEMKNKHNTMNSSSSQKTYMRMQNTLINNTDATCYLVEVIATNSHDKIWDVSLDSTRVSTERIRRISIDKFYELVTGDSKAFRDLCVAIPTVLDDVVADLGKRDAGNTVLTELQAISPNILKSLYMLSFKKYEGFDDFNIQ